VEERAIMADLSALHRRTRQRGNHGSGVRRARTRIAYAALINYIRGWGQMLRRLVLTPIQSSRRGRSDMSLAEALTDSSSVGAGNVTDRLADVDSCWFSICDCY